MTLETALKSRAKHIEIKLRSGREALRSGKMTLKYIHNTLTVTDILTKGISFARFAQIYKHYFASTFWGGVLKFPTVMGRFLDIWLFRTKNNKSKL